jgi:hypothetical protein
MYLNIIIKFNLILYAIKYNSITFSQLPAILIPVIITPRINSILECPFRRAHSHSGVGFSSLTGLSSTCTHKG